MLRVKTGSRASLSAGNILIIEGEHLMEPSLQSCLESVGISYLSEWDVFAFLYQRGASLLSTDHIARLTGHELAVVDAALGRLEGAKVIEQARSSQGVRFCRIVVSMDAGRQRALQKLIGLSETRAGRVLLER